MPNKSEAHDLDNEPLDGQQINALGAVICHVAHSQEVKPDVVRKILEEKYGVDNYAKISQADYTEAMEFLIDLHMEGRQSSK